MVIDLISPLSREECLSRLIAAVIERSTVTGSVTQTSFRLSKRIYYRNSFQASLSGKMTDEAQGTRLRCKVGLHPFVTAFLYVWIAGVSVGCIAMLWSLLSGSIPAKQSPQAAVPFLMLAGGVALLKVGQFFSRDEAKFLVDFLRRTLEARDSDSAAAD
jgi:hypothetical protein